MTTERVPDGPLAGIGPIAYGCWRFAGTDVAAAREKIETALECGMNLIDTADIYGFDGSAPALDPASGFGAAEELLGRVLAETPGLRDRMVLATKGGIVPPAPVRLERVVPAGGLRGVAAPTAVRNPRPLPDTQT